MTATEIIPKGLCQCGCGRKTRLARKTATNYGHVKGQPLRFIHGHHRGSYKTKRLVVDSSGCHIWQLSKIKGYGRLRVKEGWVLAHRYYYKESYGSIPDGMDLHHKCGVRACVNPEHLKPMPRGCHGNHDRRRRTA